MNRQIGLAQVISDYATFAYLADVYVLENYRGRGLAKMADALCHDASAIAKTFLEIRHGGRATRMSCTALFGFEAPEKIQNYMRIAKTAGIYKTGMIEGQSSKWCPMKWSQK